MKIQMDHIARTEGHFGFVSHILNGNIEKAKIETIEGARLFEGILQGRRYDEAAEISQRICGVCPVIHSLTALKAVEAALDIKVSPETILLRKMMLLGQVIQSHTLHLYFLSLPDFLDYQDDLKMVAKYPERSQRMLELRDFGNKIIAVIGGRSVHPISVKVGGFTQYPAREKISSLAKKAKSLVGHALELSELFDQLTYPDFHRETEFISLYNGEEYTFYDGDLNSSKGFSVSAKQFAANLEEIQKPFHLIKSTEHKGEVYLVNSLARLHLNHEFLNDKAKLLLSKSRIDMPDYNTFHNVIAQSIELVHCLEEFQVLAKQYSLAKGQKPFVDFEVTPGRGVGAGEAPRGTLFHEYELDEKGMITDCNIISPTAQFLFNIQQDLDKYVPSLKGKKLSEQKKEILKMIRAYDPCISCATH